MDPFYIIDKEKNQITFTDNRYYFHEKSGTFIPSVTTKLDAYPKGAAYFEWIKRHGQDSDNIRDEAGRRGSVVHNLTEQYDAGVEVTIDTGTHLAYSGTEWSMFERYVDFTKRFKPQIHFAEISLADPELGYAGTLDRLISIGEQLYLVDIKTSNSVYRHYWLQVTAYKELLKKTPAKDRFDLDNMKLAILWLNAKTRGVGKPEKGDIQGEGWQFLVNNEPYDHLLKLLNGTCMLWDEENKDKAPRNLTYQLVHQREQPTTDNHDPEQL